MMDIFRIATLSYNISIFDILNFFQLKMQFFTTTTIIIHSSSSSSLRIHTMAEAYGLQVAVAHNMSHITVTPAEAT